ncbi:microtubule-actin cross-linking factor 1-like [Anguilla anguilla]|uniref:microtubule-actin cross-linking factor 1-like n=1 Tax=Anguilla anguilla TaxID=7936 RepID=UPI0015A98F9F|nr:microtubule-actin cross-linking factor 1-like [Anguilla anguilla]
MGCVPEGKDQEMLLMWCQPPPSATPPGAGSGSERFLALEQARVPLTLFWETHRKLEPWLEETEALIGRLPSPAVDLETLRTQQDQIRVLKESVLGHQCHVDKLLLIGPMLDPGSQEGAAMRQSCSAVERRYLAIKEGVRGHSAALEEAISQSSQFHDKMEPLLETLERAVQRLRQRPPVAVELEKLREQLAVHRAAGQELDKLLPAYNALCSHGDDPAAHVPHAHPGDPASQAVRSRLQRLRSLWAEIRQRAQEREAKLLEALDLAGRFWAESGALLGTLRDAQDITRKLEDPAVSPAHITQQLETTKAWRAEMGRLSEQLQALSMLGDKLITVCGDTEKPLVRKSLEETQAALQSLNRMLEERMQRLETAMTTAVQYQDALQGMFGYLDKAAMELRNMPTAGAELGAVQQQIQDLKLFKAVVLQQQRDMQKVRQQGELLVRSASAQSDREAVREPLTHLTHLWKSLGDEVTHRQHELEVALLSLGQLQQALMEAESWLSQSHVTLDALRPISCDPKAIEMELANHQVFRDDVLSRRATMEALNRAASSQLLELDPGEEASRLRQQLETVHHSWESLLFKTQGRQDLLEVALAEAEVFHGEVQVCLQWLRDTERQLSTTKPTGGLPETAREQLRQHMELQGQVSQQADRYHDLVARGQAMLMSLLEGEEGGFGATQTQQNLLLLQNTWASLTTKMDNRRVKLEEAVSLATGFQSSLQVCVNWLIQAEQSLNMAPPPSLILETLLLQIEEHKVFMSEVNSHRQQVLVLEKVGSELRSASLEQDEVLIGNLLLRVHSRWHQLAKSSREREQNLEEAHKTATKFQESCGELWNWLLETESRLDTELRVTNEPEEINEELAKHEELRKALCSRLPQYYSTVRSGRCLRDKASLPTDTQKLSSLLEQLRDTWDRVCAKSTQRQQHLEEAVLYSGQPEGALQLMLDWLCWAETQLQEDQPIYGDMDLVSHLLESHQVFQRELYNRAGSVQALKRAAAELVEAGSGAGSGAGLGEAGWVGVLLQELSLRWDRVCSLSVSKQTRLQQALKQAEQFRNAVQQLLVWLSGVGQTHYHGAQPEEAETLQAVLHAHEGLQEALEAKREEVIGACALGEVILSSCHPDSIALIRQRVTTLQTRYREVLMWAKQHKQALESSLAEMLNNSILLEELLSWLLWAETTLVQREAVSLPHDTLQIKTLIIEHQVFMEEMAQKRMDVERLTKSCQSKQTLSPESEKPGGMQQVGMQVTGGNPRLSQLCSLCQQVWQLSLNHQSKLSIALKRLEELEEGVEFDFDGWRRKCMQWVSRRKCNMMDMFQRVDTDQDGRITREEFTEVIVALDFPTSQWEMMAVMDLFDQDGSGNIDYYEFAAALHQSRDTSSHTTEADRIKEEVTRQVVQCKCKKRFRVEQIGENKYRLGQCECVLRILCNVLLVQMGHGWMSLNEFLMKYDPCRDVSHTQSFPRQLTGLLGGRTGGGEEQRDGQ